MTLGEQQELFAELFSKLVLYIISLGYTVRLGEVERTQYQADYYAAHCAVCKKHRDDHKKVVTHAFKAIGIVNSLHTKCLAGDLKVFKQVDGKKIYLTLSEDYKIFGDWWKLQHPLCRWGGDIESRPDGCHFSLTLDGRI